MKNFKTNLDLYYYNNLKEFFDSENICKTDILLSSRATFNDFIKPLNIDLKVIFPSHFGEGEPTDIVIDNIRKEIPNNCTRIIAIGGGSVMDIAKVLCLSGESTEDIFLLKANPEKIRQLIAIPTTCGTGSEVTTACACAITSLNTKRGYSSPLLMPDKSAIVTEVIKNLPYKYFATSSIDAFIHAAESFLSPKATPHSKLFSKQAIIIILECYVKIIESGIDTWTDFAEEFVVASNFAGIGFANAGCAAVHALSYPLGGKYHIPHGEANQIMFSPVFKKYIEIQPIGAINEFEEVVASVLKAENNNAILELEKLLNKIIEKKPLSAYGISFEEFEDFATGVLEGQQRLLVNNYVEFTHSDIVNIYNDAN